MVERWSFLFDIYSSFLGGTSFQFFQRKGGFSRHSLEPYLLQLFSLRFHFFQFLRRNSQWTCIVQFSVVRTAPFFSDVRNKQMWGSCVHHSHGIVMSKIEGQGSVGPGFWVPYVIATGSNKSPSAGILWNSPKQIQQYFNNATQLFHETFPLLF